VLLSKQSFRNTVMRSIFKTTSADSSPSDLLP
jgi:hypothetical protein